MKSCISLFEIKVKALVMKSLIHRLPSKELHNMSWPHISGLQLANPNFIEIGPIDIVLDSEICAQIMLP